MSLKRASIFIIPTILLATVGFLPPSANAASFSIQLSSSSPRPNTTITAQTQTYNFDDNRANIVWQIDGKTVAQGLGVNTITLQSPDIGKAKKITAFVTTVDGDQDSQSINLTVHDVDFIVDALTYVPPGYRGRALPTLQSSVRISAIPYLFKNGKKLPPESLIYDWFFDSKKDTQASGANKTSIIAPLLDSDNHLLSLKLSDTANEITFEKGIILTAKNISPEIIFYEDNPLEGPIYAKALSGELKLAQGAISLRAEPFYFSTRNNSNLTYTWNMNNQPTSVGEKPNILNLKVPENFAGETAINLTVMNIVNLLQSADAALRIIFGQ